jgi:hypothetical protein
MTRDRSLEVHAGWGAAVAFAAVQAGATPALAFGLAVTAGVLVESAQWAWPRLGSADPWDAVWTAVGGAGAGLWAGYWQ